MSIMRDNSPIPTHFLKSFDEQKNFEKKPKALDLPKPKHLINEKDLFCKYNESWFNKLLETKKWSEKKELLEELIREAEGVKLKVSDHYFAIKSFKLLLGDSNVQVVLKSLECLAKIALGLGKGFSQGAKILLEPVFLKLKDKKTDIQAAKTLECFWGPISIDDLLQKISDALSDKQIQFRENALLLLNTLLNKMNVEMVKEIEDQSINLLLQASDDPVPEVKKAALLNLICLKEKALKPENV